MNVRKRPNIHLWGHTASESGLCCVQTLTVLCLSWADARAVRPYRWMKEIATGSARLGALLIFIKIIQSGNMQENDNLSTTLIKTRLQTSEKNAGANGLKSPCSRIIAISLASNCKSVKTEQFTQTSVYTGEAHERKTEKTRRHKHDCHSAHPLRDINHGQLLTYASENDQRDGKTYGRGESVNDTLDKRILFLDDQYGNAKHGAVGGNQRQVNAQCLVKGRRNFLQDYLNHLHKGGNDKDESDCLEVLQPHGVEDVDLHKVRHDCRKGKHEGHGRAHAQ